MRGPCWEQNMFNDGQLINGRYHVVAQLVRGDLGFLYRAIDAESGNLYVLRLIAPAQETGIAHLRQEAEKIEALGHPNIMAPGALMMTEQHQPFLVRGFMEGGTLEDLIRREAPLPLGRACFLARQIAMALEATHHAGLIHGDLKPSNVLLAKDQGEEVVKVLGFGTLALKKDRFINLAHLAVVQDGKPLFGSPEYISPEQAVGTGQEALDGRTDIYSLGVILYQMLTRELPHQGGTAMEVLLAQVFTETRPLSGRTDLEVPLAVDTLLMRTLAKKRNDRPASATALIDQLGPWEERPVPANRPAIAPALRQGATPVEPIQVILEAAPEAPPPLADVAPVYAAKASTPLPSEDSFVPDLGPEVEVAPAVVSKPAAAQAVELDIPLNAAGPAVVPALGQTRLDRRPAIFSSFHPPAKPRRKVLRFLAIAALTLVSLTGIGCAWLYFTGRTYWFDPDFIKTQVSYYLTSATPDQTPQTEVVDQPAPQEPPAPVKTPEEKPGIAKSQPATAPLATAPKAKPVVPKMAANIAPPPGTLPKSAATGLTDAHPAGAAPAALSASLTQTIGRSRASAESAAVQDALTRGQYYFKRGDYDAAIQVYKKSLAKYPANPLLIAEIARARRAKAAEAKYLP